MLAISVHMERQPPYWAIAVFEASLDRRQEDDTYESAETGTWIPEAGLEAATTLPMVDLSLKTKLDEEEDAATRLLAMQEFDYRLIELRASSGITAQAVVITSGSWQAGWRHRILGFVELGSAGALLRKHGVIGNDFDQNGIQSLPSFRRAVEQAVERCDIGSHPGARGVNAAVISQHHRLAQKKEARAFAEEYIVKHRDYPVGTFFQGTKGPLLVPLTFREK